jgi:CxxC motif-containing protein (DUF1111 family)
MLKQLLVTTCLFGAMALAFAESTQQRVTEAPAGFDTPTLSTNPGSQSVSNGIAQPYGDTYAHDQAIFEQTHDPSTGLGPVFNARACSDCHQNPVSGGASQFTEVRVGHIGPDGKFANPTVFINDGADSISNRSIVNDRAICPQAQEHVPETENIRALRAVLPVLGDGFVEAVPSATLLTIAQNQPYESEGRIHGEAIEVPVLEAAAGKTRIGRFGWKDQHGSLLSFIADAYLNEMGVTNRLKPNDTTTVCKVTTGIEDPIDALGMADIDHFAQFLRGTKVPPPDAVLAATPAAREGREVFRTTGCNICHVETMVTAPPGTLIDDKTYKVPDALGNKVIHPFGDFLLHDIGTGDGIVQAGPMDTANKLRTAPLWGLRTRSRYMHDLRSLTLENAIERHRGEAEYVEHKFDGLSPQQKEALITFLKSL